MIVDTSYNMSFKAKNLQYESKEPAFLRRLRGEIGQGQSGDPDRHGPNFNRIAKPTGPEDDTDDGPTYVLEASGATLSKTEYEKLLADTEAGARPKTEDSEAGLNETKEDGLNVPAKQTSEKEASSKVGLIKKRKLGRVVGNDDEDAGPKEEPPAADRKGKAATSNDKEPIKPKKKKAKATLLSFDDD